MCIDIYIYMNECLCNVTRVLIIFSETLAPAG